MKKKLVWRTGIIVLILSVISLFLLSRWSVANPFAAKRELSYPQFAARDSAGHYYTVDTSQRRVLVSNSDGLILAELQGGQREEGAFFYADQVITGNGDNFYLLNYVMDDKGLFLRREEILEYNTRGKLQGIFYQRKYTDMQAELVQRGQIFSPRVQDDYMYFFLVSENSIQSIRKSLKRETTEILGETYFPDANAYVSDLEWVDSKNFIILDKRGYLIRGDIYGALQRVLLRSASSGEGTEENDSPPVVGFYRPRLPKFNFWDMSISDDGMLYMTDLMNGEVDSIPLDILMDPGNFSVVFTPVLNREILADQGYTDEPFIYYRLGYAPDGAMVPYDYGIYHISGSQVIRHFESLNIPLGWRIYALLWWISLLLLVASSGTLVVFFYIFILKRRLSLIIKQLLIIVPLMTGGIFLISTLLIQNFIAEYQRNNENNILALTQTISQSIDGDLFHSISDTSDYMNSDYRKIRDLLRRSLNYNLNSWNEGLYFAVYQVIDETLYGFMYLNNRIGMRHPFDWYDDPQSVYRAAENGEVAFEQVSDISGSWLYGVGPIYDSDHEVVAILEIGTDLFSFNLNTRKLYNKTMFLMSIIGSVIIIFITLMTVMILRSLRVLRRGVERISDGDWSYQIRLRSNDEVSELGRQFNTMSQSISSYLQQIRNMNESYQKFFPDQFLKYLDLQSLTEVKLGDQVQREMTIMFSDIRSFTAISEKMTPEENFNFLNRYLNLVGPVIRNNHGFIDKYIGDAIMALFPDTADDAMTAAVNMMRSLSEFNRQRSGQPELHIGVGIHSGELMLGILGEKERMQGTVIADSVNLAARLETLSKQMGASILTSTSTLDRLSNPDEYLKRYMGRIRVIGKSRAVEVWEILNGLSEEEIEAKLRVKAELQEGIKAFEDEEMERAVEIFNGLTSDRWNGKIADLFIQCIERYHSDREEAKKRGFPLESWAGILRPETK